MRILGIFRNKIELVENMFMLIKLEVNDKIRNLTWLTPLIPCTYTKSDIYGLNLKDDDNGFRMIIE